LFIIKNLEFIPVVGSVIFLLSGSTGDGRTLWPLGGVLGGLESAPITLDGFVGGWKINSNQN
jgi:hypothetical protein